MNSLAGKLRLHPDTVRAHIMARTRALSTRTPCSSWSQTRTTRDKTWLILRSKPQQAANDLRKQLKNNQRGRPQPNTAKEGTAMPSKPLTHLLNDAGERPVPI